MSARFCCGLAFLTLAACSASPDMHYYTLSAQPTTYSVTKIPASDPRYAIDRVEIPDLLDRPQIVLRGGPNGVDVLEYHRWAAPLPDLLQRALAADLASRLGAGAIIDPGLVGAIRPVRRITISILEFDAAPGGQAVLDASWAICDADGGPAGSRISTHRARHVAPTSGSDAGSAVATMNRLLPALTDDIAATVRGTRDPSTTISEEGSAALSAVKSLP